MAPDQGQIHGQSRQEVRLPVLVFGVVEVRRLKREIEALNDFMRQAAIREPGKQPALPRLSRVLEAMSTDNNRNLLLEQDRQELQEFLTHVESTGPMIHVSFASDPSSAFVAKLVTWLRGNIDPLALLQIGLQPTIAAGCVVRTPNKIFDLSLRQNLASQRGKLIEALDAISAPAAAPATPAQPEAQV
jgi:F0F1-type ATP synthase delta subunit